MLITACISLVCNLVNLWALGHCCGQHGESVLDDVNSVFKPHGGHSCSHGHHHDHGHSDKSPLHKENSHGHDHKHSGCSGHNHSNNKTKHTHEIAYDHNLKNED